MIRGIILPNMLAAFIVACIFMCAFKHGGLYFGGIAVVVLLTALLSLVDLVHNNVF